MSTWAGRIDLLVIELGTPLHLKTDDGEAWYWKFSDSDMPVADTLGELLFAAIEMGLLPKIPVKRIVKPHQHGTETGYEYGCKCLPCKKAHGVYNKTRNEKLKIEDPEKWARWMRRKRKTKQTYVRRKPYAGEQKEAHINRMMELACR